MVFLSTVKANEFNLTHFRCTATCAGLVGCVLIKYISTESKEIVHFKCQHIEKKKTLSKKLHAEKQGMDVGRLK